MYFHFHVPASLPSRDELSGSMFRAVLDRAVQILAAQDQDLDRLVIHSLPLHSDIRLA